MQTRTELCISISLIYPAMLLNNTHQDLINMHMLQNHLNSENMAKTINTPYIYTYTVNTPYIYTYTLNRPYMYYKYCRFLQCIYM